MATQRTIRAGGGIVVCTPITAGGCRPNHADGIVVATPLTAHANRGSNHGEGIVVSTAISAGGNWGTNHDEGIVVPWLMQARPRGTTAVQQSSSPRQILSAPAVQAEDDPDALTVGAS